MKKYYSFLLLIGVMSLTSCLKQNPALDPGEGNNVVEIYNVVPTPTASPADAVYPLYISSFNVAPSLDYEIFVSYSGAETAPEDITVTVGLNAQAINDYNDEQTTTFELLPPTMYTVDSWTVIIPKGQRTASLKFKMLTEKFDLSKSYVLPATIQSASMGKISTNFGTVLFNIVAKNKYDGRYLVSGTCVDANGLYKGDYPRVFDLETVNANTCRIYDHDYDYPNYLVVSIATGGAANTGIRPAFTFNESTNAVTRIYNINNNATLTMGPLTTAYDMTTKSFNAEWTLGRWHVTEHWVYQSERD